MFPVAHGTSNVPIYVAPSYPTLSSTPSKPSVAPPASETVMSPDLLRASTEEDPSVEEAFQTISDVSDAHIHLSNTISFSDLVEKEFQSVFGKFSVLELVCWPVTCPYTCSALMLTPCCR